MRDKIAYILLLLSCLGGFTSCIREEEYTNDPMGNFDRLWTTIDEQYCFLDYKQIDWNAIGNKYRKKITPAMSNEGLFEVMDNMLYELRDGHVNLSAAHNQSRYDFWGDAPRNFNESIIEGERYLGRDYRRAAGFKYKILSDNIGYIYYETFSAGIGEGNLDEVFSYLSICNGLIIDVRQNGGGNASNSSKIASRFTNEKVLTGYIRHKTGVGHSDFSEPYAIYLTPSNGVRWQKSVVVLTNRHSYSATNDFINHMKGLNKNITIMGDTTGGGSGMPFSSELPNGWSVRFSASPHFDKGMNQIEWGIDPDIRVDMERSDESRYIDTIIERARHFLNGTWKP